MPCVAHLGEVARALNRLASAGVSVLVVAQADPKHLAGWLSEHPQPFPVVSDPDRVGFRAFGLGRVGWLHFFRPAILWGYLRLMARGQRLRPPVEGEDLLQLGGDYVLDRGHRVVFAHPSRAATDRPAVGTIIDAAQSGGRPSPECPSCPGGGRPPLRTE